MCPVTDGPIGIFDSGVGGLSVLKAIHQELPHERLIYLADQAHVPYGPRPLGEVRALAEGISRYLLSQGAKLIVVACNTASAAGLHYLRQVLPEVPFVGMEPAVKPAVENTNSGVVGVLATPATFQGALYASVVERFAQGVTVLQDTCPGLVSQIEAGHLELLCDAAAQRQIAVLAGCVERAPDRGGHSLYCSLVYVDPQGAIQSVHRKLMPTYEERLTWALGAGRRARPAHASPGCVYRRRVELLGELDAFGALDPVRAG